MTDSMPASLRSYLSKVRQHELITKDEEIALGIDIQRMLALTDDFVRASYTDLSIFNTAEKEIIRIGLRSFYKLFYSNLRIVVTVARKYEHKSRFIDIESLIQFGNIGLIKAIEKFDPYRNIKFITYSYPWIRQHINRGITNNGRIIRLPIHISDRLDKIQLERNKYIMANGVEPSFEKLCELVEVSEKDMLHALNSDRAMVSLNCHTNEEGDSELENYKTEDSEDLFENLLESELTSSVRQYLEKSSIEKEDKQIIASYFGIGQPPQTIAKIASRLKIKKVDLELRIGQILKILKSEFGEIRNLIS